MRDSFLFAWDSLSANRRRVRITVAIIAVGVASLVGVETAVDVLTDRVAGSFDKLGAGLLTIRARDDAPSIDSRQAVAFARHAGLDPAPSAVSVSTILDQAAIVSSGGASTDPVVRVLATDDSHLACEAVTLAAGRNFSPLEIEQHASVALLGDNVRRRLFGEEDPVGREVTVSGRRLRVVGAIARQGAIFGTGLDGSLLCPLSGNETSCSLTIRVAAGGMGEAVASAGRAMAAIRRLPPGVEPDFEIVQADSAQAGLASLRSKLSLVALAIGMITLLGAAVGLMNSMLVSVKERTREIGVRRALGAGARDIEHQFLAEALLTGLMGCAAGVALGLLLGNLAAISLEGSFSAPWAWVLTAVLLASLVSLASGLLPARRAAALDPIEALRAL